MNYKKKTNQHPKVRVAFVHIPKTAGTFMIDILRRSFGWRHCDIITNRKNIHDSVPNMDTGLTNFENDRALKLNPQARSISSHYLLLTKNNLLTFPNATFFLVLRDPVKRFVSDYAHKCRLANRLVNFEDWAQKRLTLQKTMATGDLSPQELEELIITKRVQILFQDNLKQVVAFLESVLRKDLSWIDIHNKKNVRSNLFSIDSSINELVSSLNLVEILREEIEFFQFAKRFSEPHRIVHGEITEPSTIEVFPFIHYAINRLWRNFVYRPFLVLDDLCST